MGKIKLFIASSLFLFQIPAFAQVQIDKQIQLTGSGTDAKITGIQNVSNPQDAMSVQSMQNGSFIYAVSSGSNNNFSIAISPPITTYTAGMVFNFISNQAVTGPATLSVNTLASKSIKKNINQSLGSCDIQNGQFVTVAYDGANFQMISVSVPATPTSSNAGPSQVVNGTSASLAANTPVVGTGLWTIVSGAGGSISNPASPASAFTGVRGNTYVLNWTITACGSSSSSSLDTITFLGIPASISNLYVWYDANDASTFTYSTGTSLSVWADKSGNGFNASSSNNSEDPTVVTNDINGLPAVRFTHTTNTYLSNSVFTINLANRSIFCVVKENDNTIQNSRWISINGSSQDWDSNNGYEMGNDVNGSVSSANNEGAYFIAVNTSNSGTGMGYEAPLGIYADIASGGSGTFYVNGVAGGSASNPNAATSVGGLGLGSGYYGGSFYPGQLDGDMAEIIIYNRALTPTERDEVGAYLSAKWGITFTP